MRRAGISGSLGVWLALAGCSPQEQAPHGLSGLWVGPVTHEGRTADFALRFGPATGDSFAVLLSLPPIGAVDLPVGAAHFDGETISLGSWQARYDAEAETVTGSVPAALAPVYELPFVLSRAEALPTRDPPPTTRSREPRWTVATDAPVWAGVALADGDIFVANDAGTVYALRGRDGSVRWSTSVDARVRATPTVEGGSVFVHADDGRVTALERATGERLWSVEVGDPYERIPPDQPGSRYDHYGSAVLRVDDKAIVGTPGGDVVALDAVTGHVLWTAAVDTAVLGTPSTDGARVFYGDFGGTVGALDLEDGRASWRTATAGAVVGTPTVAEGRLVIGNRAYDLLGLDPEDGSVAWTHYVWFSWVESSATAADGVAYVGSSDAQKLIALDVRDGSERWTTWTEGSTWATPALHGDVVYVGTVGVADYITDHRARFHAVDRASGRPLWRFELVRPEGEGVWGFASSPAAGAEGVYVAAIDGTVYAF